MKAGIAAQRSPPMLLPTARVVAGLAVGGAVALTTSQAARAKAPSPETKLESLGLALPTMPKPLASYTPAVRSGNTLYLSGHVPFKPDMKSLHVGKVGSDYSVSEGADFAKDIGLELLSTVKDAVGDLGKVKRIVKITGFVNCPSDFTQQPEVINGCSNLMLDVFGPEVGTHSRAAVGTNSLPRNVPVEIEMVVEVKGAGWW